MSDNWVVQNLENALETWNDKLSEIWRLLTTTPQDFKGGSIWNVMVTINGAVQAIGLALLVLFFVVGVVRTCGSFTDVKKPEHALKLFVRLTFQTFFKNIWYPLDSLLPTKIIVTLPFEIVIFLKKELTIIFVSQLLFSFQGTSW